MNLIDKNLSEVLDIESIDKSSEIENLPQIKSDRDDGEYVKSNIRELIVKGSTAIDELIKVAKESEHPRAYEVLSGLLKNVTEMNKDLIQIHKMNNDLTNSNKNSNMNIDKAVFIGTTADLIKFRKNKNIE